MLLNNDNIGLLDSVLQEALDLGDIKKARQIIKRAVKNIYEQVDKAKRLTDTIKKIFKKKSIILDIFQCYPLQLLL